MEESEYHIKANPVMEKLADHFEVMEDSYDIAVELDSGVLSLEMPDEREYIINKHTPSRQIWVSSPYSGASYFEFKKNGWNLKRATEETHELNLFEFITKEVNNHLN